ncbi:MAG TPA: ATP synthase subunit C [Roseiarcus sp.]|nr:ATP synthase subunit C [Roseiarcus sp.]
MRSKLHLLTLSIMAAVALAPLLLLVFIGSSGATEAIKATAVDSGVAQWALLSAAIAAGLGTVGAGIAVAAVGAAAVGVLAEKPDLLGRVLIFVGLAEGIAIYGLIVAILILNRAG